MESKKDSDMLTTKEANERMFEVAKAFRTTEQFLKSGIMMSIIPGLIAWTNTQELKGKD